MPRFTPKSPAIVTLCGFLLKTSSVINSIAGLVCSTFGSIRCQSAECRLVKDFTSAPNKEDLFLQAVDTPKLDS